MRFALIFGIAILALSCNKKSSPTAVADTKTVVEPVNEEPVKPEKVEESMLVDYEKMKYSSAVVVDMSELDGCGFMLKLDNGKKLQPALALDKEYQVNDLPVWIRFNMKKGAVGICMSGQIVTLTAIAKK